MLDRCLAEAECPSASARLAGFAASGAGLSEGQRHPLSQLKLRIRISRPEFPYEARARPRNRKHHIKADLGVKSSR